MKGMLTMLAVDVFLSVVKGKKEKKNDDDDDDDDDDERKRRRETIEVQAFDIYALGRLE